MSENLASPVEEVSTSIEQMARSVQRVAQNAERITDAATNAASTANQMDRSLNAVVALTKRAEEATTQLTRQAEEGGGAAQKSMQGLLRVRSAMEQSAAVIREMGKRSNEIGGIVNTINVIAERTNMLSLNASIEAARAGDAGRGFAVVAEEIRNLADRSAQATADIAAIVKGLQDVVQEAIAASNESLRIADDSSAVAETGATGLRKILTGIGETAELVGQIARATT